MSDRWTPRRLAAFASFAWAGVVAALYFAWEGWGHGGVLRQAWEYGFARDGGTGPRLGRDSWIPAALLVLLPLMSALFLTSAALAGGWKRRKAPTGTEGADPPS